MSGNSNTTEHWTVAFDGATRTFNGSTFSTTFKAPTTPGNYTLSVSCSGTAGAKTLLFNVHVLAASLSPGAVGAGNGHLPNTGGPNLWWWLVAALALVSGGALVYRSRRHSPQSPTKHGSA